MLWGQFAPPGGLAAQFGGMQQAWGWAGAVLGATQGGPGLQIARQFGQFGHTRGWGGRREPPPPPIYLAGGL